VANKNEQVFVSFHYLKRENEDNSDAIREIAFRNDEFDAIYAGLENILNLDLTNEDILDKLRFRRVANIVKLERVDSRSICGIYQTSYWGHAFENSQKGTIAADSLNLRPFLFMIYLSDTGRIYIASQYLGQFGGYTTIKNSIVSMLDNRRNIVSSSFNMGNVNILNAIPKEVEIQYSKKSTSITGVNSIGKAGMLIFKKESKGDGFEAAVTNQLLSHSWKPKKEILHVISDLLKENELMEIDDEEVVDCKVVAVLNGSRKVIHHLG